MYELASRETDIDRLNESLPDSLLSMGPELWVS